jgi:capsular polysaccharide biosynthesis protein
MNRFLPILARARSKFFFNAQLIDCASEVIELAPAIDREQAAAISLPSEFDRVLALEENSPLEFELSRLRQGKRRHGKTIAYRLNRVLLAEGSLYFKRGYDVLRSGSKALLPPRRAYYPEMALITNYVIERYFGHWLNDGLPLGLLADRMSLKGLAPKRQPWLHEPGYRKLSGIEGHQSEHALIERLWAFDDRGLNDHRVSRMNELRARIRSAASPTVPGPRRVWLSRGNLGTARNLVNSSELCDHLRGNGFCIVEPEKESANRLVELLSSAEIAVTVEGSAQGHCTYALPSGSTLLTIQPPNRFTSNSKDRADAIGLNWAFVVADPRPNGFYLSTDRLMRTIDEVARVAASRPTPLAP